MYNLLHILVQSTSASRLSAHWGCQINRKHKPNKRWTRNNREEIQFISQDVIDIRDEAASRHQRKDRHQVQRQVVLGIIIAVQCQI